jgi:hypothetical protein
VAATPDGAVLTEAHRQAQILVHLETVLRLRQLAPLLDVEDLTATTPAWVDAAERVVIAEHGRSSALARAYIRAFRLAEIGEAWTGALPDTVVTREALRTSLLVTGPVQARRDTTRGYELDEIMARLVERSANAGARHALAGGRGTIVGATTADRRALGYARVTDANPCAFCALLASRGPVYKTARAATTTRRGHRYHDHCQCTAELVYRRDSNWPGQAREYRALYDQSTAGLSGQAAIRAFRRAYEAR